MARKAKKSLEVTENVTTLGVDETKVVEEPVAEIKEEVKEEVKVVEEPVTEIVAEDKVEENKEAEQVKEMDRRHHHMRHDHLPRHRRNSRDNEDENPRHKGRRDSSHILPFKKRTPEEIEKYKKELKEKW